MADISKHIYKYEEGLLYLVLNDLFPGRVLWGEKIDELNVDTDLLLTDGDGKITHVILVTHNNDDNNALKKFWRNANELFDVKRLWPNCLTVNIYFTSGTATVTSIVMDAIYDKVLVLNEHHGISSFIEVEDQFVKDNLVKCKSKESILELIQKKLPMEMTDFSGNKVKLKKLLKKTIRSSQDSFNYQQIVKPLKPNYLSPNSKSEFRRDFAKLALIQFEKIEILMNTISNPKKETNDFFSQLDLYDTPSIRGQKIKKSLTSIYFEEGPDALLYIYNKSRKLDVLRKLDGQLIAIKYSNDIESWFSNNLSLLRSADELFDIVNQCNDSPNSLGVPPDAKIEWNWVLENIMGMIKVLCGWPHGYGFSKLAIDCGYTDKISRSQRLKYSYYFDRRKDLSDKDIKLMCKVLSERLNGISDKNHLSSVFRKYSSLKLEQILVRLVGGQEFQPMYWLLAYMCNQHGVSYEFQRASESFISSLHPKKPGTTPLAIIDRKYYVHCKSAFDGSTDKRKELCGRVRALRGKVIHGGIRDNKRKYILFIDGEWDDKDIRLLSEAGWSHVFHFNDRKSLWNYLFG